MERPKISVRTVYVATAVALITFGAGYAFAAISVTNGTLTGGGNYVGNAALAYWSLSAGNPTAIGVVPSAVPGSVSVTVGTPTVLPATATSYMVNTGTAGDIAQVLKYTETTAAPLNTEIEVTITVSAASVISTTVYVETQATALGANTVFTFYVDVGSASAATVTVSYAEQISQVCSAVGTCP